MVPVGTVGTRTHTRAVLPHPLSSQWPRSTPFGSAKRRSSQSDCNLPAEMRDAVETLSGSAKFVSGRLPFSSVIGTR